MIPKNFVGTVIFCSVVNSISSSRNDGCMELCVNDNNNVNINNNGYCNIILYNFVIKCIAILLVCA